MKLAELISSKQNVPMRTPSLEDIPKEFHDTARHRARRLGMTLDDYLNYLSLPVEDRMSFSEWINSFDPKYLIDASGIDFAEMIREGRIERDVELFGSTFGDVEVIEGH
jgi:hypothetical protein